MIGLSKLSLTGLSSHDCSRLEDPEQYFPPFSGRGLSQNRCDFLTALPHVRVHADQGNHSPQFPSLGLKSSTGRHSPRKQR